MTLNDTLANAFSKLDQYERLGRKECLVDGSKLLNNALAILKQFGYVKDYTSEKDGVKLVTKILLSGKINSVGVVKPRFPVKNANFTKWEKRYLPSKDMGILLISTVDGMMDHNKVKEKHIGGRIIAYCY